MKKFLIPIFAAALCGHAFAHGGEKHPARAADIKQEQKPWGIAGKASEAKRTIEISMSDAMRFTPDTIQVSLGETVKFIVKNQGRVMHEMVIGTREELESHAALMEKFPNMAHDEPYMAHVEPQQKGEMIWTFNRPGEFEFACLIPGHFTAGMKGVIVVEDATFAEGEIRRIDAASGKITLRHGPIKNLDMPPMTMVFQLAEGVSAGSLKVGDKVRFRAEASGGRYVVRELMPAK